MKSWPFSKSHLIWKLILCADSSDWKTCGHLHRLTKAGLTLLLAVLAVLATLVWPSATPLALADTPIPGGTISANTVWARADSPYIVQGGLTVNGGVTLTIQPGVEVRFMTGTSLDVYGGLIAQGTPTQPITFTSSLTTPQRGDWVNIRVAASGSARLAYCELGYGGRSGNPALQLSSSDVVVQNCRIHDNQVDGVYLNGIGMRPTLENLRLENNGWAAIRQSEAGMSPVYRNLTLAGNGNNGVVIESAWMGQDGVMDGAAMGVPFIMNGGFRIGGGRVLTVTAGTTAQFMPGAASEVYGGLIAQGTSTQPITFTSSLTTPQRGDWSVIWVKADARVRLAYCELGYGGRSGYPALQLSSSDVMIQNCRIHDNQADGVYLNGIGMRPTLENLRLENNGWAAIRQSEAGMSPVYRNLTLAGNGNNGVVIESAWMGQDGVLDGAAMGVPFIMNGGFRIGGGRVLTVTAGTTAQFMPGAASEVYGGLIAQGTSTQPITFTSSLTTPQRGDWSVIWVKADARVRLAYCELGYGGRSGYPALQLSSSDVMVQNCRIHDNQADGVYLNGIGMRPTLENLRLENNGWAAIRQSEAGMSPAYRNLTMMGNGNNGVVIESAWMGQDGVLDGAAMGVPFIMNGGFRIGGGKVLTVTAGTTAQFMPGAGSEIYGGLIAQGTPTQPITFTSSLTTPQRGDWSIIWVNAGARVRLAYCDLGYGGRSDYPALKLSSSDVMVQNCRIHDNQTDGVYLNGAGLRPTLENLRIENNGWAAIRQSEAGMSPVYRNLTLAGNNPDAIVVPGGTLNRSAAWDTALAGAPILLNGSLNIPAGQFLSLSPGTTVRFITDTGMSVNGALYALGTQAQPITLTGVVDNPGTWYGIEVRAGASVILNHCDLAYGGRYGGPMLSLAASSVAQNCRIHHSSGDGMRVSNARPAIAGNQIYSNTFGLRNTTPATIVDARNNWWGHASGPRHASNPAGQGDLVSDGVLFDPWLQTPGEVGLPAGQLIVTVGGPGRVSPGQTVDYAVFYLNQLTQTVTSAVLMLELPLATEFVDSTGGGIYWPDQHQVFWRLGNVAPGDSGVLSDRVRYFWGLPEGLQESAMALMGGANLDQTFFDVQPYLDYAPLWVITSTTLSDADLLAERQAYPTFNLFYTQAISRDLIFGAAARLAWSDGSVTTQTIFIEPSQNVVMFIRRLDDDVIASTYERDSYALQDATGGMTISLLSGSEAFWGGWATPDISAASPSISPQRAIPPEIRLQNCLTLKLSEKLLKRIGDLTKAINQSSNCVKCATVRRHDPECTKCAKDIGLKWEDDDASRTVKQCGHNVQEYPDFYVCTKDYYTPGWSLFYWLNGIPHCSVKRCNTGIGAYRNKVFPEYIACALNQKCQEGNGVNGDGKVGCVNKQGSCSAGAGPKSASISVCNSISDAGIGCSSHKSTIQIARDPNAKYGPAGDVLPGQLVTYTITYENEGQGIAYGVYVTDQVSEYLDESTLTVYGHGTFITPTRTLIWDVGELSPKGTVTSTGAITFTIRVKDGLPGGTVIMNQAVVYFPSVPEQTPTNVVINVVQPVTALPQTVRTGAMTPVTITLQGRDVSNWPLTYTVASESLYGSLGGIAPTLIYTPAENFTGEDRFTFRASNGITASRPAEVQIIVEPSAAETIPPQVRWTDPVSGSVNIAVNPSPIYTDTSGPAYMPFTTIQFSEAMSATTLTTETIQLSNSQGQPVPVSVLYDGTVNQAVIAPRQAMRDGTTYTARVSQGVRDASGNTMASSYIWSFRTAIISYRVYLPIILRQ